MCESAFMRPVGTFLVAVVGTLVVADAARAATLAVRNVADDDPEIHYVAAPGEVNDVVVATAGDSRLMITDFGAAITATGRCRSIDAHSATCRSRLLYRARVELGDHDDRARPLNPTDDLDLAVDGGPGDDTLSGAGGAVLNGDDGDDRVYGGPKAVGRWYAHYCCSSLNGGDGRDELHAGDGSEDDLGGGAGDDQLYSDQSAGSTLDGGGGHDQLFGGPGDDWMTDGDRDGAAGDAAPGSDTINGGGGWDTLSYARKRGVTVHAGTDEDAGEVGERDRTTGIEDVYGGWGDDRLVGDHRGNLLDGWDGDDVLIGRGGDDDLRAGRGRDRLLGGRGPDRLSGGAGIDSLYCGGGVDLIDPEGPRLREVVPRHCERLVLEADAMGFFLSPHPRRTQTWWLSLRTQCPSSDEAYYGCRGTVSVRESRGAHRLLGHGSFGHGAADGASFAAPIALTRLGWLWQAGRLGTEPATVSVRVIAKYTPTRPFSWTVATPRR